MKLMEILSGISFTDLFNPAFYIELGGIWLLLFIVFAETGLMFGFFLPGDSLIFIAGIYSQKLVKSIIPQGLGGEFVNLLFLIFLLVICGVMGNIVGYWFGQKSGPYLFKKKDNFFFKKKYLYQTKDFFEQYGGQAVVIARFLPTVRTFTPIVAGIVKMNKLRFMTYNIIGCVLWISVFTIAGHYLDKFFIDQFDIDIKNSLEFIVIGLIIITSIPFIIKYIKSKRKKS